MSHTKIDGGRIRAVDKNLPTPVLQYSQCKMRRKKMQKLKERGQIIINSDDIIMFQAHSRRNFSTLSILECA